MHQALDVKDEAERLKLAQFLSELYELAEATDAQEDSKTTAEAVAAMSISINDVDDATLHLPETITQPVVHDLIQHFNNGQRLHYKYVLTVLEAAAGVMQEEPTVTRIPKPKGQRVVTVVGDLHGSFNDLTYILSEIGYPNPNNIIIFNGDFVDRGPNGLEVLLSVLSLKVAHPHHVFINRGNHEDAKLARAYDFHGQVLDKYIDKGPAVYQAIGKCFAQLPLCTVIEEEAFVVHGGLPLEASVTLKDIEDIDRREVTSCITKDVAGLSASQLSAIEGLLWSDPEPDLEGRRFNHRREAGCLYGVDTVREWLAINGLRYFVRSHQCVPFGVEEVDCGEGMKLYTVFSASNYPSHMGMNQGAVLQFREGEAPKTIAFESDWEEPEFVQRSHQSLAAVICSHKHLLLDAFRAKSAGKATVSVTEWKEVMIDVLDLYLDWDTLQQAIAPVDNQGSVRYNSFLNQYRIEFGRNLHEISSVEVDSTAIQALYRNQNQLAAVFRYLDTDHNGVIDRQEFKAGMAILNQRLGETMDIDGSDTLFDLMDIDKNNTIDMNEFCECFRITRAAQGK